MPISSPEFLAQAIAFGLYPPSVGGLLPIAAHSFLGNPSGISASPSAIALSTLLQSANNLSDLASSSTGRTNLGLGSLSTQNATAVNITGGIVSVNTLNAPFTYTAVPLDIDLIPAEGFAAFEYTVASVDIADALGLASFDDGYILALKNTSSGNCTFTPFTGEFIDGMSSLTIGVQEGFLVVKMPDQWSIIAKTVAGGGGSSPITAGTGTNSAKGGDGTELASGNYSFSYGDTVVTASGLNSFAFGHGCLADHTGAWAIGNNSQATGNYSFSFGTQSNAAAGLSSFAFGFGNGANGNYSFTFGNSCASNGLYSFSFGNGSDAIADYNFAFGNSCLTNPGVYAWAVGNNCHAAGDYSFAFGTNSTVSGVNSVIFGDTCVISASSGYAITVGNTLNILGSSPFSANFGILSTITDAQNSLIFGNTCSISGGANYSLCFGSNSSVSANALHSFSFGESTIAGNFYSFAFGNGSTSTGQYAVTFGQGCTGTGNYTFCHGNGNTATGDNSWAIGVSAIALNAGSVVWGDHNAGPVSDSAVDQFVLTFQNGFYHFSTAAVPTFGIDASGNTITHKGVADQSYSLQSPTTGFSITIADGVQTLQLTPAGLLASGTIEMPSNPIDGQTVRIATTQTIQALTLLGNMGHTIAVPQHALPFGQGIELQFNLANNVWLPLTGAPISATVLSPYVVSPLSLYPTIQSAINAAVAASPPPSATNVLEILIAPGTYTENLTLASFVVLSPLGGEVVNAVTVIGNAVYNPVNPNEFFSVGGITFTTPGGGGSAFEISGSQVCNVHVNGNTFNGTTGTAFQCVNANAIVSGNINYFNASTGQNIFNISGGTLTLVGSITSTADTASQISGGSLIFINGYLIDSYVLTSSGSLEITAAVSVAATGLQFVNIGAAASAILLNTSIVSNSGMTYWATGTGTLLYSGLVIGLGSDILIDPALGSTSILQPPIDAASINFGGTALGNYNTWATYTPTVTLVGGAGNTVPTFTGESTGRWTRIGSTIHVVITLTNTAGGTAGAGTGGFTVALPVQAGASAATQYGPIGYYVTGANTYSAIAILPASATTVTCYYLLANVLTALDGNAFNNATRGFQITLTYEV